MDSISDYWNKAPRGRFACPNPCLYRFIGMAGLTVEDKHVLELGFGIGQDLFEMMRRGAKVHGIDIDKRAIDDLNKIKGTQEYPVLIQGDIVTDILKFETKFNLVYSMETLYYLGDDLVMQCLENVRKMLAPGGHFLIQVITGDYALVDGEEKFCPTCILGDSNNPIAFRDREFYCSALESSGYTIEAERVVNESFFTNYEAMRHNLYICASVK